MALFLGGCLSPHLSPPRPTIRQTLEGSFKNLHNLYILQSAKKTPSQTGNAHDDISTVRAALDFNNDAILAPTQDMPTFVKPPRVPYNTSPGTSEDLLSLDNLGQSSSNSRIDQYTAFHSNNKYAEKRASNIQSPENPEIINPKITVNTANTLCSTPPQQNDLNIHKRDEVETDESDLNVPGQIVCDNKTTGTTDNDIRPSDSIQAFVSALDTQLDNLDPIQHNMANDEGDGHESPSYNTALTECVLNSLSQGKQVESTDRQTACDLVQDIKYTRHENTADIHEQLGSTEMNDVFTDVSSCVDTAEFQTSQNNSKDIGNSNEELKSVLPFTQKELVHRDSGYMSGTATDLKSDKTDNEPDIGTSVDVTLSDLSNLPQYNRNLSRNSVDENFTYSHYMVTHDKYHAPPELRQSINKNNVVQEEYLDTETFKWFLKTPTEEFPCIDNPLEGALRASKEAIPVRYQHMNNPPNTPTCTTPGRETLFGSSSSSLSGTSPRRLSGPPSLETVFETEKDADEPSARSAMTIKDKRKLLIKSYSKGRCSIDALDPHFEDEHAETEDNTIAPSHRLGQLGRSKSCGDETFTGDHVTDWIDKQVAADNNQDRALPDIVPCAPKTYHMSVTSEDTDNTGYNSPTTDITEQNIDDELGLGAEAHSLRQPPQDGSTETPAHSRQLSPQAKNLLSSLDVHQRRRLFSSEQVHSWHNASFGSDISAHTADSAQSGVSSIDLLLNQRKKDPAEVLENLGFGSREPKGMLSRIPVRFLHNKSQSPGIKVENFINSHDDLREYVDLAQMSSNAGKNGIPNLHNVKKKFEITNEGPECMFNSVKSHLLMFHDTLQIQNFVNPVTSGHKGEFSVLHPDNRKALYLNNNNSTDTTNNNPRPSSKSPLSKFKMMMGLPFGNGPLRKKHFRARRASTSETKLKWNFLKDRRKQSPKTERVKLRYTDMSVTQAHQRWVKIKHGINAMGNFRQQIKYGLEETSEYTNRKRSTFAKRTFAVSYTERLCNAFDSFSKRHTKSSMGWDSYRFTRISEQDDNMSRQETCDGHKVGKQILSDISQEVAPMNTITNLKDFSSNQNTSGPAHIADQVNGLDNLDLIINKPSKDMKSLTSISNNKHVSAIEQVYNKDEHQEQDIDLENLEQDSKKHEDDTEKQIFENKGTATMTSDNVSSTEDEDGKHDQDIEKPKQSSKGIGIDRNVSLIEVMGSITMLGKQMSTTGENYIENNKYVIDEYRDKVIPCTGEQLSSTEEDNENKEKLNPRKQTKRVTWNETVIEIFEVDHEEDISEEKLNEYNMDNDEDVYSTCYTYKALGEEMKIPNENEIDNTSMELLVEEPNVSPTKGIFDRNHALAVRRSNLEDSINENNNKFENNKTSIGKQNIHVLASNDECNMPEENHAYQKISITETNCNSEVIYDSNRDEIDPTVSDIFLTAGQDTLSADADINIHGGSLHSDSSVITPLGSSDCVVTSGVSQSSQVTLQVDTCLTDEPVHKADACLLGFQILDFSEPNLCEDFPQAVNVGLDVNKNTGSFCVEAKDVDVSLMEENGHQSLVRMEDTHSGEKVSRQEVKDNNCCIDRITNAIMYTNTVENKLLDDLSMKVVTKNDSWETTQIPEQEIPTFENLKKLSICEISVSATIDRIMELEYSVEWRSKKVSYLSYLHISLQDKPLEVIQNNSNSTNVCKERKHMGALHNKYQYLENGRISGSLTDSELSDTLTEQNSSSSLSSKKHSPSSKSIDNLHFTRMADFAYSPRDSSERSSLNSALTEDQYINAATSNVKGTLLSNEKRHKVRLSIPNVNCFLKPLPIISDYNTSCRLYESSMKQSTRGCSNIHKDIGHVKVREGVSLIVRIESDLDNDSGFSKDKYMVRTKEHDTTNTFDMTHNSKGVNQSGNIKSKINRQPIQSTSSNDNRIANKDDQSSDATCFPKQLSNKGCLADVRMLAILVKQNRLNNEIPLKNNNVRSQALFVENWNELPEKQKQLHVCKLLQEALFRYRNYLNVLEETAEMRHELLLTDDAFSSDAWSDLQGLKKIWARIRMELRAMEKLLAQKMKIIIGSHSLRRTDDDFSLVHKMVELLKEQIMHQHLRNLT